MDTEMKQNGCVPTDPETQKIMEEGTVSPTLNGYANGHATVSPPQNGHASIMSQTSLICDPVILFNPIFKQVEESKDEVLEKEMRTWTGRVFDRIRRRTEHANRDHVDAPGFVKNRMNKHLRKFARCFDHFPVPLSSDMIEVQDNQGRMSVAHLSAWAKQLLKKESMDFEIESGIDRDTFIRIIQNYPRNDPDYITKEEFHNMMCHYLDNTDYNKMNKVKIFFNAIAYAEEVRWWPPPCFTPLVMFIEIFVFLYHFIFLTTYYGEWLTFGGPLAICSSFLFHPHRKWEAYRFFTYAFVHNGPIHLINNLLVFTFIGIPLELTNKWWRVGFVYFCGILSGSMTVGVFDCLKPLVGASGGVYALVGAHAASLILNWKEDSCMVAQQIKKHKRTRAIKTEKVRVIRLALIATLAIFDTSVSVYQRYGPDCQSEISCPHTSFLAHFSGALTGLVVGVLILKNRKCEYWEKIIKICFMILAIGFFIMGVWSNFEQWAFQKFIWVDPKTFVTDNRTWSEVLPICQQAIYVEKFRNETACDILNWPAFRCAPIPVPDNETDINIPNAFDESSMDY